MSKTVALAEKSHQKARLIQVLLSIGNSNEKDLKEIIDITLTDYLKKFTKKDIEKAMTKLME